MSADRAPSRCSLAELIPRYDGLLLDAYGVLVDARGALPGGRALIAMLHAERRPFWIVTNGAARLPERVAERMRGLGLAIDPERVITSGELVTGWFAEHALSGARTIVLGTPDSHRYVERAGGAIVPLAAGAAFDALVLADEAGYDFLPALDLALSAIVRRIEHGAPPRLCLPNPDLVYPTGDGGFGFTAGAAAALIEAALDRRFGTAVRFDRLGKPHPPLFREAIRRAGTDRLLVIGDQLETDIAGARGVGLDAALLETGVSRWQPGRTGVATPTYVLSTLG